VPWPEDIHVLEARGASYELRGNVFLATSAAFAATGTVLYLVGRSRGEHLTVAPSTPGRSAVGVAVAGSF
jgi:hypothetical protein